MHALAMTEDNQRQLVGKIAASATDDEIAELSLWLRALLDIRASDLPPTQKAFESVHLTGKSAVIWGVLKLLWRELKRRGWDNLGWPARLGFTAAGVGILVTGGQGAGIAGLGTAIGVPLWIVFGSGASFAGIFIDFCVAQKKS